MKKILPEPRAPRTPHPSRVGGRREGDVQSMLPSLLDPKKKPQQICDFEGRNR